MGVYHQATTVIGYEISTAKFFVQTVEPNCEHNPTSGKHCPDCGKPVGTRKTSHAIDEWWEFSDDFVNNLPDGYVSDTLYDNQENKMWFGYGSTVSDEDTVMLPTKSYEQIKADIAVLLEPYTSKGIIELDEKKFGIWTLYTGH